MAGVRNRRWIVLVRDRGLVAPVLLVTLTVGCKSGGWGAKPSWWSFGGTPPASSLTAAPSFDKDVTKPSEATKPYQLTSTPEAYSLAETPRKESATSPAGIEPTSVTYGATPPAAATAPPLQRVSAAPAEPDRIGPQVGPYAGLEPASQSPSSPDPAAAATAGLAAAPAFGEAAAPTSGPVERFADNRASNSWSIPAAQPAETPDPRSGQPTGSRFSSPPQAVIDPVAAPTSPAFVAPPAAAPVAPPAAPAVAPSAAPPAATMPAAAADVLPGEVPPPRRRPDRGYRPGGTSSYRPGGAILANEAPPGGVEPVAFQAEPAAR